MALLTGFIFLNAQAQPYIGSPFGAPIAAVADSANVADTTQGNRLVMISHGYDALLLRVHLIRQAKTSICIQTFIWTNDECGRLLICELIEAARRGVKVRIIADHLFSDQNPEIVAFLASVHPNFEVKHYRPATSRLKPSMFRTAMASVFSFHEVNQRMHSKVMVFDDTILLTGGRNIENTYYDHSTTLNFRDRDVLAIGPVVRSAVAEFEQFWKYRYSVPSRELLDVANALKKGSFKRYDHRTDYDFGPHFEALGKEADDPSIISKRFVDRLAPVEKAAFIYDAPGKSHKAAATTARITKELVATLESAKRSIVMQTPYLVLSGTARDVFAKLRREKPALQITVSTNSFASTDNLFAYSANYRLRNDYVENLRLRIYEFKPQPECLKTVFPRFGLMAELAKKQRSSAPLPVFSLHAKSLVVDDRVAFVGSYNLDPRSAELNTEVGLLIEDPAFARALRSEIQQDMQPENSWVIARRQFPLGLDTVNGLIGGIIALTPLDIWPIQNTSSFELLPGAAAVPPEDPAFNKSYRDAGSFPGTEGILSQKEILTRLFKAVGSPLTPVL
ncbi:MAG: phospholipase D family protein [Nibricoccus sp.]